MGLSLFFVFTVLGSTIHADPVWSPWYNSSPGPVAVGRVENETLDRIAMTYTLPCSRSRVVAVQCRVAGNGSSSSSNATFSGQFRHAGNVLHVPCNLTGLLCRPHDQILAGTDTPCRDYEVRVLCLLDDEGLNHPEDKNDDDDDDLGANGGFTAMVAGGSVVIPLTCVLIFQLRRYKREERQRQQQSRQAADDLSRGEATSSSSDAPPTYEELFGRPEPVSTISSGVLSAGSSEVRNGTERLLTSYTERLEGRVNPGASLDLSVNSLVASTSVPESNSVPSSSTTTVPAAGSSSQVMHSHSSVSSSDTLSTSASSSDDTNQRMSLTSSASSSTATSTDILMPPSSSGSDVTHPGPPPAYDWPASAHVTIVVPESGGGRTSSCPHSSSSSGVVQSTSSGGRRFLGMHLSIFDLMAAIYPDPASTPPPSYDDALKILEASKASQVQIT